MARENLGSDSASPLDSWCPTRFLDAAAGLPPSPQARQWLDAGWTNAWADPMGRHTWAARSAAALQESRVRFAAYLQCAPSEVWFAPSADAALATAVTALGGRADLPMLVSPIERLALLRATDAFARPPIMLGLDRGLVQLPTGVPATALVVQAANREVGATQPLDELAAAVPDLPLIVDATAVRVRSGLPKRWDVIVLEPSSWGGPSGLAVVGRRTGLRWTSDPFPGRVAVPLVAAAAMTLPDSAEHEAEDHRLASMGAAFAQRVARTIPDTQLLTPTRRVAHIISLSFLYVNAEQLVDDLAAAGFAVHSGSACTSDLKRPSHVLTAMGALTHGNLRVSLPPGCPQQDLDDLAELLVALVERQRTEAGVL